KRAEKRAEAGKANVEAARAERTLKREKNAVLYTIKVRPGAVEPGKLTEVVMDVRDHLEEEDPTYGEYAPLEDAYIVVTLTHASAPPPKDPKAKPAPLAAPVAYQLHPLGDAGVYGFHATLPQAGKWDVKISGARKDGKALAGEFSLHAGVWPPPDFDQEEKNNIALGGGGRRAVE
ncbi:MAG: hypothetical protein AB2A00_41570, partial [Myxococcota bacterium]